MFINELRIKKVCNIVLQSSKHEKTTFLQTFIFVLSRFYWTDIINKKKKSKVDGWEIGYKGIGI